MTEEQIQKPKKKNRKGCLIAILIFIFLPIIAISVCVVVYDEDETATDTQTSILSVTFDQVGYWKEGQVRMYTYDVIYEGDRDSIPEYVWNENKDHGKEQTHTEGGLTHTFYYQKLKGYANLNEAPSITGINDFDRAYDRALESKPIMVYSINMKGINYSEKYPKE